MTKTFAISLEYLADLPSKPGDGQIASIQDSCKRCLGGVLIQSGWKFGPVKIESTEKVGQYKLVLALGRRGQRRFDPANAAVKAEAIADKLAGYLPGWKRIKDSDVVSDSKENNELTPKELLKFPDKVKTYFDHIYDRDVQIREILDVINLARDTDMNIRHHVLLYGPPGAGKTEIGLTLTKIFGDLAVKRLDATATTKSGAERMLLEATPVPPIIVLEEIEKVNEANLPWLLAVLDARGEIIKTTSRMNVSRLTKCLLVATANNIDKLRQFHDGALIDRFAMQLYCPMPDEILLRKILLQEVNKIPGGRAEWIDPAIEYALHVEKTYQVRRIKAIMAIGRDRLLNGSYQREHNALRESEQQDNQRITEFQLS